MATYRFANLNMKEGKLLADLNGVEADLRSVIDFCRRLIDTHNFEKYDGELLEVLSIAVLVKYIRPFMTGVRSRLRIEEISGLSAEEVALHEHYMAIRHKHISHSINEYEENQVCAYYTEERLEEGFTSISVQHARIICLNIGDAQSIINLSEKIVLHIKKIMEREKETILEIVRGKSMDDILNVEQKYFDPSVSKPNMSRS